MCFADGGRLLVTLGETGELVAWSAEDGSEVYRFRPFETAAALMAGHPERPVVAMHNGDVVRLVDLAARRVHAIRADGALVAFGSNGWLAVVEDVGRVPKLVVLREGGDGWEMVSRSRVSSPLDRCVCFFRGDDLYVSSPDQHSVVDPTGRRAPGAVQGGGVRGYVGDEAMRYENGRLHLGDRSIPWDWWGGGAHTSASLSANGFAAALQLPDPGEPGSRSVLHTLGIENVEIEDIETEDGVELPDGFALVAVSPLGGIAIAGGRLGTRLRTAAGWRTLALDHPSTTCQLAFSPDAAFLAVGGSEWTSVVDAEGRSQHIELGRSRFAPASVGPEFVIDRGRSISRWNAAGDFEIGRYEYAERGVPQRWWGVLFDTERDLVFADDRLVLATIGENTRNLALAALDPPSLEVLPLGISSLCPLQEVRRLSGGRFVVTAGTNPDSNVFMGPFDSFPEPKGVVQVFDRDGDIVIERKFTADVGGVAESSDGRALAVVVDRRVLLLDPETLTTVRSPGGPASWVGFLRDDLLLTAHEDRLEAWTLRGVEVPVRIGAALPPTSGDGAGPNRRRYALAADGKSFAVGGFGTATWYSVEVEGYRWR